jgi:hypothetical protein
MNIMSKEEWNGDEDKEFNQEEYNEELERFRREKMRRKNQGNESSRTINLYEKEEVYDWALDTDMNPDWTIWENEFKSKDNRYKGKND